MTRIRLLRQAAGRKLFSRTLAALMATVCGSLAAHAGPPSILSMFQERSTAASEQHLALKDEHGPWLIVAHTFSGDDAEAHAIELAKELRTMLKAPVYVYRKDFDHSRPLAQASAKLDYGNEQKVYRTWIQNANAGNDKNYSVLVGDFTSADDPRKDDMLKRIKTAHPKCLERKGDEKLTAENIATKDTNWLISAQRKLMWQKNEENAKKGPMKVAFMTRNPLLPADYFQNSVDDFVVKLNEKVEHSLLKAKGRYTVRVAMFSGKAVTEIATGMAPKQQDEGVTNSLDQACLRAGLLCAGLRAKGVEAYEFHDRNASYVTIGSFDTLGEEAPGGGPFIYNPEMVSIMNQYCGYEMRPVKDPKTGYVSTTPACKTISVPFEDKMVAIPFDIEGKFISIPRPATSKLYQGSLLGKSRVGN